MTKMTLHGVLAFACIWCVSICGTEAMVVRAVEAEVAVTPANILPAITYSWVDISHGADRIRITSHVYGRGSCDVSWLIRSPGLYGRLVHGGRRFGLVPNGVLRIELEELEEVEKAQYRAHWYYNGVELDSFLRHGAPDWNLPGNDAVWFSMSIYLARDAPPFRLKQLYCTICEHSGNARTFTWDDPADLAVWEFSRVVPCALGGGAVYLDPALHGMNCQSEYLIREVTR